MKKKRDDAERGSLETKLWKQGETILGVDEVGRGCLAGPVFAAAAALDPEKLNALDADELKLIRDSKTLSANQRQKIQPLIIHLAYAATIGVASVKEIETIGILKATFLAMTRAIEEVKDYQASIVLVDGHLDIPKLRRKQMAIIDGDFFCYSIAAASILAKEARDTYMAEQGLKYPEYGFERHVGYGTKLHCDMLEQHGICPLHRRNFAPVKKIYERNLRQGL